jgi:heptosyltransferase-2
MSAHWPAIKRDRTFVNQPLHKILIVLIAGIGDLVLASKAIRSVRGGYPGAEIHLLTSSDAAPLAKNDSCIDRVWAFPIREFRKDRRYAIEILRLIRALREIPFRSILNLYAVDSLSGAMKMGLLFSAFPSPVKAGHDSRGFGFFLTNRVPEERFRDRHISEAMLEVALSAGGVRDDQGIAVRWGPASELKWKGLFAQGNGTSGRVIVGVNPGGDRQNRRWDPDRYAAVADRIIDRHGARVILLGSRSETGIAGRIESRMRNRPENLSGRLTLDELTYVIGQLDLLITNDSGPMHIGAALGVPLVAVFGPEDPRRMGPCAPPALRRVLCKEVPCRPCTKSHCDVVACLEAITADEVYEASVGLLGTSGRRRADPAAPSRRESRC